MVGVLAVGFVANLLVRPVADRFHESADVVEAAAAKDREAVEEVEASSAGGGASASPVRVYLSWGLMIALLAYGVIQTLITASKLFG